MKLTDTMIATKIKAYAVEHAAVLEAYKAHYILAECCGNIVTVTAFICDDVRNHRKPDNTSYAQQFSMMGGTEEKGALIHAAKREIDTHSGLRRRARCVGGVARV